MKPVFLTRTEPAKNIDRFYTLRVTPTLFGEWLLLREWGRRRSPGTVRGQSFADEREAEKAGQQIVRRRLRHGYAQR